jgi:hypothetical protein
MGGPDVGAIGCSFRQKCPANNGSARFLNKSAASPREHARKYDFGGDCAAYMTA